MKQRMTLVVGGLLLLAGCVMGLYLMVTIVNAHLSGIFAAIVTDAPSNTFTALNCPLLLGRNETSQVSVAITNPVQDSLEYSVTFAATGLTMDASARAQTVVIAGRQTMTLVWKVATSEIGNQAIAVQALSKRDLTLPGPFHTWPTSFEQGCGVFVMDTPLTGTQVAGLSGFSVIAGIVLVLSQLSRRWRERKARQIETG